MKLVALWTGEIEGFTVSLPVSKTTIPVLRFVTISTFFSGVFLLFVTGLSESDATHSSCQIMAECVRLGKTSLLSCNIVHNLLQGVELVGSGACEDSGSDILLMHAF